MGTEFAKSEETEPGEIIRFPDRIKIRVLSEADARRLTRGSSLKAQLSVPCDTIHSSLAVPGRSTEFRGARPLPAVGMAISAIGDWTRENGAFDMLRITVDHCLSGESVASDFQSGQTKFP